MPTTIDRYREAKETYQKLHNEAKKELLARFHELAGELLQIQKELREDFAMKVPIPTKPKGGKAKKAAAPKPSTQPEPGPNAAGVARLEKRILLQKEKLENASKTGANSKVLKDRLYELEDELRLAKEKT